MSIGDPVDVYDYYSEISYTGKWRSTMGLEIGIQKLDDPWCESCGDLKKGTLVYYDGGVCWCLTCAVNTCPDEITQEQVDAALAAEVHITPHKAKICNCDFCVRNRRYQEIVDRANVDELQSLITELRNRLCDVEEELNVDECILNGSWPSSRSYAQKIIEACDKKDSALDPLSEHYIGHIKAIPLGVKCCCDRSIIDCPFHGR